MVFPPIPQSCKRKQLPLIYLKAVRLLGFPVSHPLVKPVRGNQAPARLSGSRNAGFVLAVSERAFIILAAADGSCAHEGINPHRISDKLPDWFLRMLADHRDRLGRGDVVPRRPVVIPMGSIEVFLDKLLPPRQSVSSAHAGDYGRFEAHPHATCNGRRSVPQFDLYARRTRSLRCRAKSACRRPSGR